jgi:hypothetical protein
MIFFPMGSKGIDKKNRASLLRLFLIIMIDHELLLNAYE